MKAKSIDSIIDPAIIELGKSIRLKKGEVLTQQFAKANDFYMLKSGKVNFSLTMDDSIGEVEVGASGNMGTPIGWSGFSAPGRYATTVKVDSHMATFIHWPHHILEEYFNGNPDGGTRFLRVVCSQARGLIKNAINVLDSQGPSIEIAPDQPMAEFQRPAKTNNEELVRFLRRSAFFETFEEVPLEFLSQNIEPRLYQTNDLIYRQGTESDGLYILGTGNVRFSHYNDAQHNASFRQVNTPGYIIGWSGTVDLPYIINAHAGRESLLYFISNKNLERILKLNPEFAADFYKRLLWLISHQLQAIRVRIIASRFNQEIIAISNLIDQNSARLELTSPIHKVPHLLDNKLTVGDALDLLEKMKVSGSSLERNVANSALEILDEIHREYKFYQGLVGVYHRVIHAPEEQTSLEIRKQNALDYQSVFNGLQYVITGMENLPDQSGNIFIYNHLRNHPYNTLPNQFQITLDSHFISAMVLMAKYNDPGLRIVRLGQSIEFAHQEYYQRLGHINVLTEDSGASTKKKKEQIRQMFYHEAGDYINSGGNLIISPEGNSYGTEESTGPFKSGAFNLALSLKKEPLIIPIALANFDKRVRNNCFSCIILPPIKVSDYVSQTAAKSEMKNFLKEYRRTYRTYVEQAIEQGERHTKEWRG